MPLSVQDLSSIDCSATDAGLHGTDIAQFPVTQARLIAIGENHADVVLALVGICPRDQCPACVEKSSA
jgi:hypothetical protein